jgi:preprotein translocase subunit SecE
VEEVLPALQHASPAQGNEVVAVDAVRAPGTGWVARVSAFARGLPAGYRSIMAEMRRVTWPDRDDIKRMSIGVIVLSLGIGAVIAIIDFILQQVLVRWIPQIFAGR